MRNLVLLLSYEGTDFFGWQTTLEGPSVENEIQCCLERIFQETVFLQAASRTDRGVHAEGQIANFYTRNPITLGKLKYSLNSLLPPTIRVLEVYELPISFHPSLDSIKKVYHYYICNDKIQLPGQRLYSWHVPYFLDFREIKLAAQTLLGTHDFSGFCNTCAKGPHQNSVCTLESIDIACTERDLLKFVIIGDHFLYKMVRTLVGTLIYIARKKLDLKTLPAILQNGYRPLAGVTAPAHGLFLHKISYPQECLIDL